MLYFDYFQSRPLRSVKPVPTEIFTFYFCAFQIASFCLGIANFYLTLLFLCGACPARHSANKVQADVHQVEVGVMTVV